MSPRGRMRSPDLVIACGLAVAGLLVSIADPGSWLQGAVLAPLVLVVPGYAIAAALFPPASIRSLDRVVYSFVFSLSAASLGGLGLQLALDLDRVIWLALLVSITVAASAVAQSRRATPSIQQIGIPRARRLPRSPLWAIAFLAALTITAGAIAVATGGVHEQQGRQRFASLWALPGETETGAAWIKTGVWNHGGPARFKLEISGGGEAIFSRRIRLGPNERWSAKLRPAVPPDAEVLTVTLKHGSRSYRSLELSVGEAE
ncbi:MAG TPA: DUF1616 domain-containing protein [Solirubrobacterales bacterium]|nr:DUF1616 domain-containing protein [Solirubrobacterales bacterium]